MYGVLTGTIGRPIGLHSFSLTAVYYAKPTLNSNFHGSINGSKYEFVRLKYRIEVVIDVAIFICTISLFHLLDCGTYVSGPIVDRDQELV